MVFYRKIGQLFEYDHGVILIEVEGVEIFICEHDRKHALHNHLRYVYKFKHSEMSHPAKEVKQSCLILY